MFFFEKKEWWMQLSFQEREERSLHSQAWQRPVGYRDDRELELTPTLNMCLRYLLWTSGPFHSGREYLCPEKCSLSFCLDPY